MPGREAGGTSSSGAQSLSLKDRVLVVDADGHRLVVALPGLVQSLGAPTGLVQQRLGSLQLGVRFATDPPTLMLEPLPAIPTGSAPQAVDRRPPATRFACWFAWYALQDRPPSR
jgi:hypothetical protein